MKTEESAKSRIFLKVPAVFVTAVLFVVFLCLFLGGFDNYSDAGFLYSFAGKGERVLLAFLALSFFVLLYRAFGVVVSRCSQKECRLIRIGMWLCFFLVQGFFLFYIRSYYKWDSGFVIGGAASLAESGSVAEEALYYLSVYPNQNTFVVLTAFLIKLCNFFGISVMNRPLVFNLFNTVCMDVSVFLIYCLTGRTYILFSRGRDTEKAETDRVEKDRAETDRELCRILLLLFCNPFLYLGVSYYYTITLSWPFTVGCLYLILYDFLPKCDILLRLPKASKSEPVTEEKREEKEIKKENGIVGYQMIRWMIAGLLLGIGYELRATAVILAIAAFLIGILDFFCFRTERRIADDSANDKAEKNDGIFGMAYRRQLVMKAVVILAAALLSSQLLATAQRAYVGIDTTNTAFPTSHWIMMSLTQPGGHNAEDESFTASFATKEEKEAAVRNRISEKLQAMGVKGYLELVSVKIRRTFGDGMNGYTTFLADGYGTGWVYDCLFGAKKDLVVLWHQGYYLFLMAGMLFAIAWTFIRSLRLSEISEEEYDIYKIAGLYILILFGAVLFYVLWEASEQYSVPFMPVMLCLAGLGIRWAEEAAENINRKKPGKTAENKTVEIVYIICRNFVLLPAILFAVWSIARFSQFTQIPYARSHTAAVQIMANAPTWVDDGEELVQELTVKRPFNHLVMQWRNPLGEENDAEYEIMLGSTDGQLVCMKETIRAAEGGNNGAGIYTFDRINPSENGIRDYEIRIRKINGSPDCDLQFVLYDMYGYTPYPGGSLFIYDKERMVKKTDASLLFLLSEETEGAYTSYKKYIFFTSCLFLIFLFTAFCCKIEKIGKIKNDIEVPT